MAGAHRLGQPVAVRPLPIIFSLLALTLLAGLVVAGGRLVQVAPAPVPSSEEPAARQEPARSAPGVEEKSRDASRPVEPDVVVPPDLGSDSLEREAPRAPLSELSLALPPKPKDAGPTLFRPVAVESAVVESMGRRVTIAGTVSVAADETCQAQGQSDRASWPCGVNARTAFRLFLRGRALACDIPKDAGNDIVAACRLGKQDVGQWLVLNGWARAAPGGPYAEAQAQAEKAKKGIFGRPPATSGVASVPSLETATPLVDQPVLAE